MPELIFLIPMAGLLTCCSLCLWRIWRGPTPPDRAVAIDILGIVVVGFAAILSIAWSKSYFLNVSLVWALLSFIGTLALAKHLEGKSFDE